jgi:glycosyltransferase involved in cell wall biosynthesis
VSDSDLRAELARAGVVLMPSRYEGLGLVALEAQAAGALVVGYDVDGLRDAVADPLLLVPPGDVSALVALTLSVVDQPERRAEVADRVLRAVRAAPSWDAVARRLEEVYAQVTSR